MKHLGENVLTDGILSALSSILRYRGIEIRSAARQGKGKKQQEQVGSNIHRVKREIYTSFHLHEFDSKFSLSMLFLSLVLKHTHLFKKKNEVMTY